MPERKTFRDSALRAVAVIGLIAILVLGAWGIIQIVFGLPDLLNNMGGFFSSSNPQTTQVTKVSAEGLSLSAPSITTTGQPLALSWSHTGATSSNFGFLVSYSCAQGLTMEVPTPSGSAREVPCNTPFNFTNATQDMTLTPKLVGSQQATIAVFVAANRLSDGKITAVGSSTVTILPTKSAQVQTQSATPAPQQTQTTAPAASGPAAAYTPSGRTSNLYGLPDLTVRILSAQPVDGRYSVQFVVENDGTNVAPYGWEFTAQLPTNPPYAYVSQTQQRLYPGDKIVYTLGFDMPSSYAQPYGYGYPQYQDYYGYGYGNNTFSVTVDPQNLVAEFNKANNTANVTLSY